MVDAPRQGAMSAAAPTAAIVPSLTATASANGRAGSSVWTRVAMMMASAVDTFFLFLEDRRLGADTGVHLGPLGPQPEG